MQVRTFLNLFGSDIQSMKTNFTSLKVSPPARHQQAEAAWDAQIISNAFFSALAGVERLIELAEGDADVSSTNLQSDIGNFLQKFRRKSLLHDHGDVTVAVQAKKHHQMVTYRTNGALASSIVCPPFQVGCVCVAAAAGCRAQRRDPAATA